MPKLVSDLVVLFSNAYAADQITIEEFDGLLQRISRMFQVPTFAINYLAYTLIVQGRI